MVLKYKGSSWFRQRLICATLSGKAISIKDIRSKDEKPGVRDYEVNLLRLLEKLCNGCKVEIDVTGTSIYYRPGIIVGGEIEHDCGIDRGIGYFLEVLVLLCPFGKTPLNATLHGVTNDGNGVDISVDMFKTAILSNMKHFGIDGPIGLKVIKRGASPDGGGTVYFNCPIVKNLTSVQLLDEGTVQKVRGIAYTSRCPHNISTRLIESSRTHLKEFCDDVYIHADEYKRKDSGNSSGYGLILVAETSNGCILASEKMAKPQQTPEDLAKEAVDLFLLEILRGGCLDTTSQSLAILFMALGPEDVSKVKIGKLTPYTIQFLRNIRDFFGLTFKIDTDPETKTVTLACLGSGYKNLSRRVI